MIEVLIADDHALARSGFAAILSAEDDIEVVGEAADGAEAVEQARRLRPDVVVMDIRMPRMDGIEATRRIAEDPRGPRILVLTTFDLDEYVFGALRSGAAGFMLKDAPPSRFADAVRTVAAGDALLRAHRHAAARRALHGTPGPGGRPPRRVRGAQRARARGRAPHRARDVERRDRVGAVPLRGDGQDPCHPGPGPSSACATGCRPSCWRTRPG